MTSKELNQIDEILSGTSRYKFLDPTRKAFLALPLAPFKLWMTYWTFESDEQEAYPSNETIEKVAGMTENTIRTARAYLLKTGWLVKLTGSAADKYPRPSRGSRSIAIYRVNDPTNNPSNFEGFQGEENNPSNVWVPKFAPNVCSCCCSCPCSCIELGVDIALKLKGGEDSLPSLRSDDKPEEQEQRQRQKQQQKPVCVSSAAKWLAKYDAPMPVEFNSWNQETRSKWTVDHDRKNLKVSVPVEVKPEPKPKVLPVESKAEVPALPPVVKSATPMSPKSGYESHEPVTATVTAPAKAPVLSATPAPPNSALPPKAAKPLTPKELFAEEYFARLSERELEDEPEPQPYSIPDYLCGSCDATFPGNGKGGKALDKHLHEVHGIKPR